MPEQERKYTKKVVSQAKVPKKTTTRLTPRDLDFWKKKTYSTPDGKQIIEIDQTEKNGVNVSE